MAEASDGRVACPNCGKQYRWKPDLAGRKVVCKCGQKMQLPGSPHGQIEAIGPPPAPVDPNEASTYDLEFTEEPGAGDAPAPAASASRPRRRSSSASSSGSSSSGVSLLKCPSCNQPLKPGAILCVKCGYNLELGKQLQTDIVEDPDPDDQPPAASKAPPEAPADIAAMGGNSAVSRALEDREDEVQPSKLFDLYLPLGLIILGLLTRFAQAMFFGDDAIDGALQAAIVTAIDVAISIPLLLLALMVSVYILSVSFGPLGAALFKLLAILLGPAALGDMVAYITAVPLGSSIAGGFAGFLFVVVSMWFLLSKFFDLDGSDAFYVLIIMYVVNFIVTILVAIFAFGIILA
ncbi:hypothetical protein ACERK3_08370 [Phycisphaerales bacterium AB-hyl4]|uniref:Yip1 domain-containing protein n=1 Tax=Natronomicrosphaera hydrolytica TaxID=3242702 RepID=A0ABV4U3Z8_9BACT